MPPVCFKTLQRKDKKFGRAFNNISSLFETTIKFIVWKPSLYYCVRIRFKLEWNDLVKRFISVKMLKLAILFLSHIAIQVYSPSQQIDGNADCECYLCFMLRHKVKTELLQTSSHCSAFISVKKQQQSI